MKAVFLKQVCLLIAVILVWNGYALAADGGAVDPNNPVADTSGWADLKQLSQGYETKVVLTDGTSYRGNLRSVSDDELVIFSGDSGQTFARNRVQRVSIRRPGHRGRNALIGLAIGAGAGLGIGAAMDASCESFCFIPAKAGAPVLFGPIGDRDRTC
jgi:hypothetical protein